MASKTKKTNYQTGDPVFIDRVQSGYDPATNAWRNYTGARVDRENAIQAAQNEIKFLGTKMPSLFNDKMSTASEKFERLVGGYDPFNYEDAKRKKNEAPNPIPGNVLAGMRLAEYYYRTEGDVASVIETPIQLGMRDIEVQSESEEVRQIIERLYDVDNLGMKSILRDLWLSVAVYSIGHPLEVWDGDTLRSVLILPPQYVRVGSKSNGDALLPFNGDIIQTQKLLETTLPTALYQSFINPQENKPLGMFNIPDGSLYSIRGLDQRWMLYPKPWLQGAFRAMSTRVIYEEMRRSIYEGFRHQLWVFLLGSEEKKPSPELMRKLIADVEGMAGERTGSLAWWNAPLEIQVHGPKTDNIMSGEEWWLLSLDIFRRIGINMRVATGNNTSGDRGGQGFEIDVDLALERIEYMRRSLLDWERGFRIRFAKKIGDERMVEEFRKAKVVFSLNTYELRQTIKDALIPLFTTGALSVQTLLRKAGISYESELANKKKNRDSGDEEFFQAPATFSQTVAGPNGDKTTSQSAPKGRPNQDRTKPDNPSKGSEDEAPVQIETPSRMDDFNAGMGAALEIFRLASASVPQDRMPELVQIMASREMGTSELIAAIADKFSITIPAPNVNVEVHAAEPPKIEMPPININPQIDVKIPDPIAQEPPVVNVTVEAAKPSEAPVINFSPTIEVPAQEPPKIVNEITVASAPAQIVIQPPVDDLDIVEETKVTERNAEGIVTTEKRKKRKPQGDNNG